MARQKHNFPQCETEENKGKAKVRSESAGWCEGKVGPTTHGAVVTGGPRLPIWTLPSLEDRGQRQKCICQEGKEMLLESRASKAFAEMKYWEKPDSDA